MSFLSLRYCPCCKKFSRGFVRLSDEYVLAPANAGLKHPIQMWETLNYKEYWCPKCGASDRDRLMTFFLESCQDLVCNKHVIEFAPSKPITNCIKSLSPRSYMSVDKYMPNVDIHGDLTNLKELGDSSTDFWICSHVLEHIQEDAKALHELHRILRSSGLGLLLVPISMINKEVTEDDSIVTPAERLRHFGQDDHVRIYNHNGLIQRAQSAGFKVSYFEVAKEMSFLMRILFGITKTSRLYLLSKR